MKQDAALTPSGHHPTVGCPYPKPSPSGVFPPDLGECGPLRGLPAPGATVAIEGGSRGPPLRHEHHVISLTWEGRLGVSEAETPLRRVLEVLLATRPDIIVTFWAAPNPGVAHRSISR